MTDDNTAVSGYDAGYVPCPDMAATEPATDDNGYAVSGYEEGYVAVTDAAASEPAISDSDEAVSGFSEGYVANPCNFLGTTTAPFADHAFVVTKVSGSGDTSPWTPGTVGTGVPKATGLPGTQWLPEVADQRNDAILPSGSNFDAELRVFVSHPIPVGAVTARIQAWIWGKSSISPSPTATTGWSLWLGTWAVSPVFTDIGTFLAGGSFICLPVTYPTGADSALGAANPLDVTFPVSGAELKLVFGIVPTQTAYNGGTPNAMPTTFSSQSRWPSNPDQWGGEDRIRMMVQGGDPLSTTEFYTITWYS